MVNYVVAYDLRRPGQNYPELIAYLETFPMHWHFQQSGWIVGPASSAYDLADDIKRFLDDRDLLFVQRLTEDSAWWGYDQAGSDWILDAVG